MTISSGRKFWGFSEEGAGFAWVGNLACALGGAFLRVLRGGPGGKEVPKPKDRWSATRERDLEETENFASGKGDIVALGKRAASGLPRE